ncbi:hypothetical protein AF72_11060 [Xylella taiwanensis]|uniref:Uncharacterized protein n=1 Tax=Xylella taiwanensis TaxID=1444770 RepID=Z9JG77_9GAMM|nr:hypothetical protein AF72_11060 [Xylella taiwanensis]
MLLMPLTVILDISIHWFRDLVQATGYYIQFPICIDHMDIKKQFDSLHWVRG